MNGWVWRTYATTTDADHCVGVYMGSEREPILKGQGRTWEEAFANADEAGKR
jgi:hypothetical protein